MIQYGNELITADAIHLLPSKNRFEDYMDNAIEALNRECGSVQGYLRELGVGEKEIGEIRSKLLISCQ